MTAVILMPLLAECEKLAELHSENFEHILAIEGADGAKFDLTQPVAGSSNSLSEINDRVSVLTDLVRGLKKVDDLLLVPMNQVKALQGSLVKIVEIEAKLKNDLNTIDQQGGPGTIEIASSVLQSKDGSTSVSLGSVGQQIDINIDSALTQFHIASIPLKGESYYDFVRALKDASQQVANIRKLGQEAKTLRRQADTTTTKIQNIFEQADELREEVDRLKTEAASDRKSITDYVGETAERVKAIEATDDQARKLQTSVDAYETQFQKFHALLDEREKTFTDGKAELERLIERSKNFDEQIERRNLDAEKMLEGATVAGLASSFGKKRDQLAREVGWARVGFYTAIALLVLSVLPLALYVYGIGTTVEAQSLGEFLGQAMVRLVLIVPAAWLTTFAAVRHAALFQLKEHYEFKQSIAMSVEGFKQQAKEFEQEIAAATFFELTFNPADRLDKKTPEQRVPNPVMARILKKLGKSG